MPTIPQVRLLMSRNERSWELMMSHSETFVIKAQSPSAGTLLTEDDEVILQFQQRRG
jgi:hypothetical protein